MGEWGEPRAAFSRGSGSRCVSLSRIFAVHHKSRLEGRASPWRQALKAGAPPQRPQAPLWISQPCFERRGLPNKMLLLMSLSPFVLLENNQEHMYWPVWTSVGTRGQETEAERTGCEFRQARTCIPALRLDCAHLGQGPSPL